MKIITAKKNPDDKKVHWRQKKLVDASFIIVRCKRISPNVNKWSNKSTRTFNHTKPNRKRDNIIDQMEWHMCTNRQMTYGPEWIFQNQNQMQIRIQKKAAVSL